MFEIKNNVMMITKGDSAKIAVGLTQADGEVYSMQPGDTLTMTVRKKPKGPVLFSVVSDVPLIKLTPEETKKLVPGKCCFDIELKTSDGDVYTVVGIRSNETDGNLIVYPEITE